MAFLAGTALICVFAWRRFSEPTYDVNAEAFRDFKELKIWNLKDSVSLRRAYIVYCISLVAIYAALTFFGRVIFQLLSQLNVSGLQISVGTIEFDSWQWPLALALGISGFSPLINPLIPAELGLRRFAHEIVGIPTRLREKSIRLKTLIDGLPDGMRDTPVTSDWVRALLGSRLKSSFVLHRNLSSIVAWSHDEHIKWSDPEIRRKLNEYERTVREDAEDALLDFAYLTDPKEVPDSIMSGQNSRLKEYEKRLTGTIRQIEQFRDQFSIIMAIYSEYGSQFSRLTNEPLRDAIVDVSLERERVAGTGLPLYAFLIIFVLYFSFISAQWHPPISSVPLSIENITIMAMMETLKVFLLVWLPTMAVVTFTRIMYDSDPNSLFSQESVGWQSVSGFVAAVCIAAVGMALYAILYSALPASNIAQMQQTLFGAGGWTGALVYYLLFAIVSGICFLFVNLVRAPARAPGPARIAFLALLAGGLTFVYLGWIVTLAAPPDGCLRKLDGVDQLVELSVWNMWWQGPTHLAACFAYYSSLDLIVISAAVLISVLGLARRRRDEPRAVRAALELSRANEGPLGGKSTALAVVLLAAWFVAGFAGSSRAEDMTGHESNTVVLGFRSDIQPFSYQLRPNPGESKPYLGYVADLCYEIFHNSGKNIVQVTVPSKERFRSIRHRYEWLDAGGNVRVGEAGNIDVLCDATTLRLQDEERMRYAIFSPIIFVSGISYLSRSGRSFQDVEVGYLENSTAERVAKEACTVDVLRVNGSGLTATCRKKLPASNDCRSEDKTDRKSTDASRNAETSDKTEATDPHLCTDEMFKNKKCAKTILSLKELAAKSPSYILCPMPDHDQMIQWFCSNTGRDKIYFGDRDIILAKLADWKERGYVCNDVRDSNRTFTYEPYALLISKADPELASFVQRRVYELFSHRAGAEALFHKWFPGQTMSEPLAWLFVLNGVTEQGELLNGRKDFPAVQENDGSAAAAAR